MIICVLAVIIIIYCAGIIFFRNHFYLGTKVNNIYISAENINSAEDKIKTQINNYSITLKEKEGYAEKINGNSFDMNYKKNTVLKYIMDNQNSINWLYETLKENQYSCVDIFSYSNEKLLSEISKLKCLNYNVIEPQNAMLRFNGLKYTVISEVEGTKVNEKKLISIIKQSIYCGKTLICMDNEKCYEKPKYYNNSMEVVNAYKICNKYISAKINYDFETMNEILNMQTINKFIEIDDDFNVKLDDDKIKDYIEYLCEMYDTYGSTRKFITSTKKEVYVEGGNYGYRIDKNKEFLELLKNIKNGEKVKREPKYIQKGNIRGKDDIGDTYVEVNLTSQCLWFYKNGKLIVSGDVVTGDVNKGCTTPQGTYSLNYKQKDAVLNGAGYSSQVKYWMPFNGNIGLHDASWRSQFGGNIYISRGTHGCVNMPVYMAKKIFENIDEKTPVICYKEKSE